MLVMLFLATIIQRAWAWARWFHGTGVWEWSGNRGMVKTASTFVFGFGDVLCLSATD
jgi:hypothetical protein